MLRGEHSSENDFSRHLRDLASGEDGDGESLALALVKIRRLLIDRLKRMGMWSKSPRLLGIPHALWPEPGALDELVHDAYCTALLAPAPALQALLEGGAPSVDAAVTRNLGHFLTRRQRSLDPLGYRVYALTRQVFEDLVSSGEALANPPGGLGNRSHLVFEQGSDQAPPCGQTETRASVWGRALMPDLLTARHGHPKLDLLARLTHLLRELGEQSSIPFGEVVAGLRRGAREFSGTLLRDAFEPPPAGFGALHMGGEVGSGPHYLALVDCIDHGIPSLAPTAKTRGHLERLWHFVQLWTREEDEEHFPSRRQLEVLLRIPRPTLEQLFGYLATQLDHCLAVVDRRAPRETEDRGRRGIP